MTTGLSLNQFERIAGMGPAKADGRKVLIRAPKHGLSELGESSAYYTIDAVNEDEVVCLVPVAGDGTAADSTVSRQSYGYTHGGSLYQAAVDTAKELASAWDVKPRPYQDPWAE